MNWLKHRVNRWLHSITSSKLEPVYNNSISAAPNMSFNIYNAVGGKVVEFRSCNPNEDYRTNASIYIIPSDADFGERISKIVTLESLKG